MWPWLAIMFLLAPALAHAHGAAPRALAPLAASDAGVELVRLSLGLAQRRGDAFEFVCPALWGGDEFAPSIATAARALVAPRSGLYWLEDGAPRDSGLALPGAPVALASAGDALFVLLALDTGWAISNGTDIVWSAHDGELGETSWLAIDTDAQHILLAGTHEGVLEQLLLSADGKLLEHASEPVLSTVVSIDAHLSTEGPYLTLLGDDGQFTLGRFDGGWHALSTATASLAGPVASASGALLVSVDGALSTLSSGTLVDVQTEPVTGLARFGGESFASIRDGLCAVDRAGCTARVFDFAQLRGPALASLSTELRDACEAEWQHMQVDLSAAGLLAAVVVDAGVDAGIDAGADASLDAAPDSSSAVDAGSKPVTHTDGCQLADHANAGSAALLTLLWACSRRRRAAGRARCADPRA